MKMEGVWHVQEMTGRRPEGGREGGKGGGGGEGPAPGWTLQQDRELVLFPTGFTFGCVSSPGAALVVLLNWFLRSGPGPSCPPSCPPPAPPWALHLFFSPPLSRGPLASLTVVTQRFPICFRLPLAAVGPPPAIWARVASPLALPAPDSTEGGMEGRRGGAEENREGSHLADAALGSQETGVGAKGTRETVTPHLGSALFL